MLRLLEKDMRKRYRDAHHLQEELKALQRSLPSQAWEVEAGEACRPPPPPPPPQSAGVTEWASRAALFARMVSRAYPRATRRPRCSRSSRRRGIWRRAPTASRARWRAYTRKLEALERRGRALRAEIGRKVEELAHEESRVLREAAVDGDDVREGAHRAEAAIKIAESARQLADAALRQGATDPAVFERAGAAAATAQAKREQLARYEKKKATRESSARDLRRQIEELRSQLQRYAEALEEDLAQGREHVATRTREGLSFEKAFSDVSNALLAHLRTKPECRDLVTELLSASGGGPEAPESRASSQKS
jgi:uncharacterized membrane-anchored protein YhcB (DUF1043 family)